MVALYNTVCFNGMCNHDSCVWNDVFNCDQLCLCVCHPALCQTRARNTVCASLLACNHAHHEYLQEVRISITAALWYVNAYLVAQLITILEVVCFCVLVRMTPRLTSHKALPLHTLFTALCTVPLRLTSVEQFATTLCTFKRVLLSG